MSPLLFIRFGLNTKLR